MPSTGDNPLRKGDNKHWQIKVSLSQIRGFTERNSIDSVIMLHSYKYFSQNIYSMFAASEYFNTSVTGFGEEMSATTTS